VGVENTVFKGIKNRCQTFVPHFFMQATSDWSTLTCDLFYSNVTMQLPQVFWIVQICIL